MKKFVIATAMTVVAGAAFAGGMSEPMMEAEVVTEVIDAVAETGSSSGGGLIIPLILLALIAAAAK